MPDSKTVLSSDGRVEDALAATFDVVRVDSPTTAALDTVDCAVVAAPAVAAVRARTATLPVVAVISESDDPAAAMANGATDVLPADAPPAVVTARVRGALETGGSATSTEQRLDTLLERTTTFDRLGSEGEIYEHAISVAQAVLDLDACAICRLEDGELRPVATVARRLHPASFHGGGEGVAGRTIETGETQLVDDVRADADAKPTAEDYRAVLSVPLDDDGVFQAISTASDTFTPADRELAELLVTSVEHALERVRYEDAVTRERDRFAALFQNIPDAALQYTFDDGDPYIDRVNSAFVRLFGYDPNEAVGESVADLLVPGTDGSEELYAAVDAGERLEREVVRVTEDGEHPFLLRSVPISTDGDEPTGYFIYTDIAEMKARERRLTRQNERLDAFASVVSHDLRNPLSVARAYTETAYDGEDPSLLPEVLVELDRMDQMIGELLTLAREGDIVGETETVSLAVTAREAWSHVETAEATLTVASDVTLAADGDRLEELFENLFRNAVEHATPRATSEAEDAVEHGSTCNQTKSRDTREHAGESVTVTVGGTADGFYVADDGPGIPDEQKDAVLEMGYTTATDGTGFGLGIVSEIASAHGWTVSITDGENGGCRFEFVT
ncbi:ATP-binding protein [Haloarchaeobius sp. DT45]|uniref:ATP-binding protein n=1 Tax=Haloarchaeobius sp. DT45 TaxID=3446116 RepID=UPI003F6A8CB2